MCKQEHMWDTLFSSESHDLILKMIMQKCREANVHKKTLNYQVEQVTFVNDVDCFFFFTRKQVSKHHILDSADLFHPFMRDSCPLREWKELSTTAFLAAFLPPLRETRRQRKWVRLQIRQYGLLFCVTLISPWPNLFPQRSLGKLLAGAQKCTEQKTQSCCDRRSCYKVSCGELSLCEVLSTHCSATETFQPSSSFSSPA